MALAKIISAEILLQSKVIKNNDLQEKSSIPLSVADLELEDETEKGTDAVNDITILESEEEGELVTFLLLVTTVSLSSALVSPLLGDFLINRGDNKETKLMRLRYTVKTTIINRKCSLGLRDCISFVNITKKDTHSSFLTEKVYRRWRKREATLRNSGIGTRCRFL